MNKKIEELAEQFRMNFSINGNPQDGIHWDDVDEFAELIVRECFKIVDDYGIKQARIAEENYCGEQLYVSMKITDSAYKIKEHFGIE